jgi:hypothetical protein
MRKGLGQIHDRGFFLNQVGDKCSSEGAVLRMRLFGIAVAISGNH